MARYLLVHTHGHEQCGVAYAAWRGFDSPLRHARAMASCSVSADGDSHRIWWELEADGREQALNALPPWVAERTEVSEVGEVAIP